MRYLFLMACLSLVACESAEDRRDRPWEEAAIPVQATDVTNDSHYVGIDAYVEDGYLRRVYFDRDGRVNFPDCFVDADLNGECLDKVGHTWIFEGAPE